MKKVLFIFLIFCFSLNIISCSSSSDEDDIDEIMTTDTTAATLAEVTFVTTPTNDSTPDYTFSSDEAGTITYGGSCSSSTTSAIDGNNTITLVSLSEGTYSNCTITVTDSAGNASSALSVSTFVVDTTAPSVSSFTLSDTALITGDNATVTLVFSEAVASFSSSADITVANGTLAVMTSTDNITWAGTFTPTANTEDDNNTLSLATSYTDTAGNTGPAATTLNYVVDTTAPTVSSISTTADNQSSVSITDNITVTFSEAMEPSYVTTNTSDTFCAGTLQLSSDNFSSCVKMSSSPESSNSNRTFTLDPYDNLTVGTTYKTRVTTGVKDTAGNAMSSQYETSSGFTPADLIAPTVSSISPTDNQSSVSVSDNISLTFSEIMDNSSITTNTDNTSCYGSFQVSSDNFSTCVQMSSSPSISNSAKTFTFDPSDNLSYDYKYKIKLTTDTKDENGVSLESPYETSFNTFDNSLVAYYPFNGNAKDLTSNGRDFTVYGGTTLTNGKDNSSNSAYSFDGNGDYLEYTANIPSFDNYTISLWAKPASSGTYEAMFSSYDNSGNGFQIDLDGSNFHIRKSSGGNIVLSTAQLGVWTFIAFTYDGTNSIGYINNESPVSDSGGTTEFNRFRIGRNRNGNKYYTGAIDELRIYNRALTASEISSLYAN